MDDFEDKESGRRETERWQALFLLVLNTASAERRAPVSILDPVQLQSIVDFRMLENSSGVHCKCMGEHKVCVFHLYPAMTCLLLSGMTNDIVRSRYTTKFKYVFSQF